MHDIKFLLVYITSGTRQLEEKLDVSLRTRNGFRTVDSKSIDRRKDQVAGQETMLLAKFLALLWAKSSIS